jgi:hypothetical protein
MNDFSTTCFVCKKTESPENLLRNEELNLPVCSQCKGCDKEKEMVKELTKGLADGFVCGCI